METNRRTVTMTKVWKETKQLCHKCKKSEAVRFMTSDIQQLGPHHKLAQPIELSLGLCKDCYRELLSGEHFVSMSVSLTGSANVKQQKDGTLLVHDVQLPPRCELGNVQEKKDEDDG